MGILCIFQFICFCSGEFYKQQFVEIHIECRNHIKLNLNILQIMNSSIKFIY